MIAFLCEEGWLFLIQDILPCLGRPYKIFTREDWTEACLAEADIVVSAHGLRPWINEAAMAAAKKASHGQKSLFGPGVVDATPLFTFVRPAAGTTFGAKSAVSVTGNPFFSSASHIDVVADPHVDSYVKLVANVPGTVTNGDTLVAIFWVRDADGAAKMPWSDLRPCNQCIPMRSSRTRRRSSWMAAGSSTSFPSRRMPATRAMPCSIS